MQELQVFPNDEFGSIRVVVIKDETWFVGKDIAIALGYVRPENAVTNRVDEDDRIFVDKKLVLELGISFDYKELGQRGGWIINESGMYALIFDSKLKTAKKFKHWVTSEVLPTIRQTGSYGTPKTIPEQIQLLAQGNVELNQRVDAVDNRVKELGEKLKSELSELPILGLESDKITTAVRRKGVFVLGGKESAAYKDKSLRTKVYNNIYANLKYNFGGIKTYKAIKRNQCDKALEIIQKYEPPVFLKEQIDSVNNQMVLDLKGGAVQ